MKRFSHNFGLFWFIWLIFVIVISVSASRVTAKRNKFIGDDVVIYWNSDCRKEVYWIKLYRWKDTWRDYHESFRYVLRSNEKIITANDQFLWIVKEICKKKQ